MRKLALPLTLLLLGCVGLPQGVVPIRPFALDRYLGRWYEIARLDHSFERGLSRVTAEYSLRPDGGVRVLNRGFSEKEGKWKEAEGRAYLAGRPDEGFLKVSFFGPFYGAYVVVALDPGYRYALVCGPSRKYLWILARQPRLDEAVRAELTARASSLGFDADRLIWVDQP